MRAVIADDSVLVREGLARMLGQDGIEVVARAVDHGDALRKIRAHKPDVAITDIRMPPSQNDEGIRVARTVRDELPGTGVPLGRRRADDPLGPCRQSRSIGSSCR